MLDLIGKRLTSKHVVLASRSRVVPVPWLLKTTEDRVVRARTYGLMPKAMQAMSEHDLHSTFTQADCDLQYYSSRQTW